MDKFEQLQVNFNRDLDDLVKRNIISASDAEIVRQTFSICARRIIRIEISNMIEFAKAEKLL